MSVFNDDLSFSDIEQMLVAILGTIKGTDSNDKEYKSIQELWNYELNRPGNIAEDPALSNWYTQAYDYWDAEENCPATDDGVLGGYGILTPLDVRDSVAFINHIVKLKPELILDKAADLGAGCGRVTKNLLLPLFKEVHLFEQSKRLVREAPSYIGEPDCQRVICTAQVLQDFKPEPNTYDVIWIQWCIGHLHDLDFIQFFRQAAKGLKSNGLIVSQAN